MDSSLLATKLQSPPATHPLVPRPRLLDTLEQGVAVHKLMLVSGPAGYGKTTLLAQWARSSRFPIAWLSADRQDNDFERFFRYLLAAWTEIQPGLDESPLGLLLGASSPDHEAVLSAFINAAAAIPNQTVFVLDDCHLIDDAAIYEALTFLLDHLPATLHLVLAGRTEPPLPLARYRARQELLEIRTEDLAFQIEETETFLRDLMHLDLTHDEIVPLQTQLEGWIAGLQLTSLTFRHREPPDVVTISGRQRFIADYLTEDVLAHLPEETRRFLLQTSILDRLHASLCDAVLATSGSQAMLELVERDSLFLVPLDDRREWFRYHNLFADFLHHELRRHSPDEVPHLHRRAARWYLDQELPEQAFHHALTAGDVELVTLIAELYFPPKLFGGEVNIVKEWLGSIPENWYTSHPELGLARASFLVVTGNSDACARCLDDVEQRLILAPTTDTPSQLAKVSMLRCAIACFANDLPQAETYADRALRDLRDEDRSYRADIYHALGDTYRGNGRWPEAKTHYLKVLDVAPDPATRLRLPHVYGALADLELRQGHLRNAAAYWHKALASIQDRHNWGRLPLPVTGWVYLRMGELLYEWNDLAGAWDHLTRGLERAELGGDVRSLTAGYVIAARLKLTEGNVEAATDYLERARPLLEQATFPDWTNCFERCQLDLWLAQDRLRAAVDWSDAALQNETREADALLTLARILIVKGDETSTTRATEILSELIESATFEGRLGIQIEALALQSLANRNHGDAPAAMTTLERALRLAEPEGYLRLFADLGLPMARLLQEAGARAVMPDYVRHILTAFSITPHSEPTPLPEPLSPREQEVLTLIAAGLTNREIANHLIISPETVKKHTANILAKLGATNRTEAAAKARALDVLG